MKVSKDKRHLFSQDPPRKLAKDRMQVAKRWGELMAKDHVIRMECARLSFTETWWCIVTHLFSRYSPRKLAKATLLWLLLAKAKTQVAKGLRKIMAKDHVILTKSKRVFYTAQLVFSQDFWTINAMETWNSPHTAPRVRLVECGVGDLGLSCLARLLASRQPAANLKELNLMLGDEPLEVWRVRLRKPSFSGSMFNFAGVKCWCWTCW